ncbi:hypothetical protein ACJX0J_027732, partial [Zea mays]
SSNKSKLLSQGDVAHLPADLHVTVILVSCGMLCPPLEIMNFIQIYKFFKHLIQNDIIFQ